MYDSQIKRPDLAQLDEPFRKLGNGLEILQTTIEEFRKHSCIIPNEEALPAKDYFDEMVLHANLKKPLSYTRKEEAVQNAYNSLLAELTKRRREWIMVVDGKKEEILFCNKREMERLPEEGCCDICRHKLSFQHKILSWKGEEASAVWEAEDEEGNYYQVNSFLTKWQDQEAYAHVIMDTTAETRETMQLADKAYNDPGTGIKNRRYFEEYMDQVLEGRREVTLCYLDLDGLKYVNDRFGHLEGDAYLREFVSVIKPKIRNTDVFARIGGDEFCLIFPGCHKDVVSEKIEDALRQMIFSNKKEYPVSFSFGITEIHKDDKEMPLSEIIKTVDAQMYLRKKENKQKFHQKVQRGGQP